MLCTFPHILKKKKVLCFLLWVMLLQLGQSIIYVAALSQDTSFFLRTHMSQFAYGKTFKKVASKNNIWLILLRARNGKKKQVKYVGFSISLHKSFTNLVFTFVMTLWSFLFFCYAHWENILGGKEIKAKYDRIQLVSLASRSHFSNSLAIPFSVYLLNTVVFRWRLLNYTVFSI